MDAHALGRVLALEVAGDVVQLGEAGALGVGQQQLDRAQRALELLLDAVAERLEALARRRARRARRRGGVNASSARRSSSSASALLSTSSRGRSPAPISSSTSSTARSISSHLVLRRRGVDDVQDQVGQARLLERRAERVDELVGQLADEADGVGQQVRAAVEAQHARRRVERVEEPVADADLGARERG